MRSVFTFIGGLAVLIVGAWVVFTFVLVSDEDRIHRLIQKCKRGFESGSVYALSDVFAPGYTDQSGADRAQVLQTLQSYFQATSSRSLTIYRVQIDINDDSANAVFECRVNAKLDSSARTAIPRMNELNNTRLEIQLELARIKQRWKISSKDVGLMM